MDDASTLQQLLNEQAKPACATLTPFRVETADLEAGHVTLVFEAQPAFRNHFGNVQGGFAAAMMDVLVSVTAYAKTRAWLPTVEMKCSFLAPLTLGVSRGEARVLKVGRQLVFLEASLRGNDGVLAVHATATLAVQAATNTELEPPR